MPSPKLNGCLLLLLLLPLLLLLMLHWSAPAHWHSVQNNYCTMRTMSRPSALCTDQDEKGSSALDTLCSTLAHWLHFSTVRFKEQRVLAQHIGCTLVHHIFLVVNGRSDDQPRLVRLIADTNEVVTRLTARSRTATSYRRQARSWSLWLCKSASCLRPLLDWSARLCWLFGRGWL